MTKTQTNLFIVVALLVIVGAFIFTMSVDNSDINNQAMVNLTGY